jgi:hypothetical protein
MKKSVKSKIKTFTYESKNAGLCKPGDKIIYISKSMGMNTFTVMQPGIVDLPPDTTWCSVNDKIKKL